MLGPGVAEDFVVAMGQEDGRLFYEWRIDVGRMGKGEVRLRPNQVIGFDVGVEDKEEDGSFSWMAWGRWLVKVASTGRRGDALLAGEVAQDRRRRQARRGSTVEATNRSSGLLTYKQGVAGSSPATPTVDFLSLLEKPETTIVILSP